jgi:hypothetical protein
VIPEGYQYDYNRVSLTCMRCGAKIEDAALHSKFHTSIDTVFINLAEWFKEYQ